MDKSTDSGDAIRRLEELVDQLSTRVERLEEELRSQRAVQTGPLPPPLPPNHAVAARHSKLTGAAVPERVSRLPELLRDHEPDEERAAPASAVKPPLPAGEKKFQAILAELESRRPGGQKHKGDLEIRIVTYWFPRIGLGLLALMFIYVAQLYSRGPWPKLAFGYAAALGLAGAGLWQRKRQPVWAEPVIAGGLGLSYFMTYSLYFVRPMKVIDSLPWELVLLTVNVVLVLAMAQWLRSEVVAGVALVLGYFTTGVSGTERYALLSVGFLSVAAVCFMVVNRWIVSTVVAVIATYAAHLYAWLFIGRPASEPPEEIFWHHAAHLIAYFAVYAIGAILAQRRVLEPSDRPGDAVDREQPAAPSGAQFLSLVVRVNIGLFVSGMILLLRRTGVYWDQAWAFFFPLAAVAWGLSRLHARLAGARFAYEVVAAVGVTFGLVAAASSAWLPVLLAVQAVGMLIQAQRNQSVLWGNLSLLVLFYAGLEALFPGKVSILGLGPPGTSAPMAWWTVMAVTVLCLGYVWVLQKRSRPDDRWNISGLAHAICFMTAILYAWGMMRDTQSPADTRMAILWAGPLVAAASVALRISVWQTFTIVLTLIGIPIHLSGGTEVSLAVFVPLAVGAGLALEKLGSGDPSSDQRSAGILYLAMHCAVALLLGKRVVEEWFVAAETAAGVATVLIAVVAGSRRLFWSAVIPAVIAIYAFFPQWLMVVTRQTPKFPLLAASLLVIVLAALLGTESLGRRAGSKTGTQSQQVTEFLLMLAGGAMITVWGHYVFGTTFFVVAAVFGALLTAGSVLAGRSTLILIGFLFLIASGLILAINAFETRDPAEGARVAWSAVVSALLLVGTERILVHRRRLRLIGEGTSASSGSDWQLSDETADLLRGWIATGAMAVLLLGTYAHPSVRSFYLSAAIVAAGFAWIVLGLVFNAAIYRKVGFGVVCFAVIKALGYDTRRLSRELQIVSLGVLGCVLLLAGWLYSRYRTRLLGEPPVD